MVDIVKDDRGQPAIRVMERAAVKGMLDRVADYITVDKEGEKPARPPSDVVADLMVEKEMTLPVLRGIVQCPVLVPPGILNTRAGYQPEAGLYLDLVKDLNIPLVPSDPNGSDIERALGLLLEELLADFPFIGAADRAHALAVLLLPFVRPLISGPTPLHLLEASVPGSGKSLLAVILAIPAAGQGPDVMTEGRDEDEWRKRLTAKLLQAPQYVLIDNVRSRLDSAALSAALTAEVWEDRVLGQSRVARLPVSCTWLATANNPGLSLEVARRTVSIRLEPGIERPWLRGGFRHPKLQQWAREARGNLIWAALTLAQAWVAAGQPSGGKSLGSYESWAAVMGGILQVTGVTGFLENMDRVYASVDQEVLEWREFCSVWWGEFQDFTVRGDQLFALATERGLLRDLWAGREAQGSRVSFGRALSKMKDRVIGDYRVRWAGENGRNKVSTYRLELITTEYKQINKFG